MATTYELLKHARSERKRIAEQSSALIIRASKERRSMTPEEDDKWTRFHVDVDALGLKIGRLEKQHDLETELAQLPHDTRTAGREDVDYRKAGGSPGGPPRLPYETAAITTRHLPDRLPMAHGGFSVRSTDGLRNLSYAEVKAEAEQSDPEFRSWLMTPAFGEKRALGGTSTTGDSMIPQGFMYNLDVASKWYGGIITAADYINTNTGNLMPYPSMNDTVNAAEITAENSAVTVTTNVTTPADPVFAAQNFSAYMYDSGIIQIPVQLMDDGAFDIEHYLIDPQQGALNTRIYRKLNADCTVGTGVNQPNGVVNAATLGITGATTGSVSYNELINLLYSVDKSYRVRGAWMFNDTTERDLRKLTDSNNRPLWIAGGTAEGIINKAPDTLAGYTTYVNNDVPSMGSNAKSILFGDFSKYKIRRVRDVRLCKFVERYMTNLQIGFLLYCRFDGQLVDAGMHPVKYFRNSAT